MSTLKDLTIDEFFSRLRRFLDDWRTTWAGAATTAPERKPEPEPLGIPMPFAQFARDFLAAWPTSRNYPEAEYGPETRAALRLMPDRVVYRSSEQEATEAEDFLLDYNRELAEAGSVEVTGGGFAVGLWGINTALRPARDPVTGNLIPKLMVRPAVNSSPPINYKELERQCKHWARTRISVRFTADLQAQSLGSVGGFDDDHRGE